MIDVEERAGLMISFIIFYLNLLYFQANDATLFYQKISDWYICVCVLELSLPFILFLMKNMMQFFLSACECGGRGSFIFSLI